MLDVIEIGQFYAFATSGKIYRVLELEDGETVHYIRVADGSLYSKVIPEFKTAFRELSAPERDFATKQWKEKEKEHLASWDKAKKAKQAAIENGGKIPRRRLNKAASKSGAESIENKIGEMVELTDLDTIERVILPPVVKKRIITAAASILNRDKITEYWGLQKLVVKTNKTVLNLHGPSGTGKTMTIRALAKQFNLPLYQVRYDEIEGGIVGLTEKLIAMAFRTASARGAMLFLDEADALLLSRDKSSFYSAITDSKRIVFMQELDRFDGIVAMSTNLYGNYDQAMVRRISHNIKFTLPEEAERKRIWEVHLGHLSLDKIPNINYSSLAAWSKGLSGGDILNACTGAIEIVSATDTWVLTMDALQSSINIVIEGKKDYVAD